MTSLSALWRLLPSLAAALLLAVATAVAGGTLEHPRLGGSEASAHTRGANIPAGGERRSVIAATADLDVDDDTVPPGAATVRHYVAAERIAFALALRPSRPAARPSHRPCAAPPTGPPHA